MTLKHSQKRNQPKNFKNAHENRENRYVYNDNGKMPSSSQQR